MEPADAESVQLATFDPPLADAVVTVLRREGIPARSAPLDHEQVEVTVPTDHRDRALALLASRMEAIRDLARGAGESGPAEPGTLSASGDAPTPQEGEEEEEAQRPLLLERLRRVGYGVAALLIPLLAVTVAGGNLPAGYALAVFIGGLVAVTWWRSRRRAEAHTD